MRRRGKEDRETKEKGRGKGKGGKKRETENNVELQGERQTQKESIEDDVRCFLNVLDHYQKIPSPTLKYRHLFNNVHQIHNKIQYCVKKVLSSRNT